MSSLGFSRAEHHKDVHGTSASTSLGEGLVRLRAMHWDWPDE